MKISFGFNIICIKTSDLEFSHIINSRDNIHPELNIENISDFFLGAYRYFTLKK